MTEIEPPHERENQGHIEHHIGHHRDNANTHRGSHILASIKTRRQHLDEHKSAQSHSVGP